MIIRSIMNTIHIPYNEGQICGQFYKLNIKLSGKNIKIL